MSLAINRLYEHAPNSIFTPTTSQEAGKNEKDFVDKVERYSNPPYSKYAVIAPATDFACRADRDRLRR